MRLKINIDGQEKWLEVNFWSFMKCTLLVQLALTGIWFLGLIMIGVIFGLLS